MTLTIETGRWEALGSHAAPIRRLVFVIEQQVPEEEEWDGMDTHSTHFIAWQDANGDQPSPIGTARLLPDGHIGRVAVLKEQRGLGVGVALMQAAIDAARQQDHARVVLSAQLHALAFYEHLGFVAYGDTFLDAGIPHREMVLTL
ncbi:GNAT family N-acetyltransferase [Vreelandella aquamarina]|uniref:GNAT family N-acetyltransferase n=1 Tax=Vreelandella aquamarina TaxID=77097 RepID=UPI00384BCA8A